MSRLVVLWPSPKYNENLVFFIKLGLYYNFLLLSDYLPSPYPVPVTTDLAPVSLVMPKDLSVDVGNVVTTRPDDIVQTSPSCEDHAPILATCDQGVGGGRVMSTRSRDLPQA